MIEENLFALEELEDDYFIFNCFTMFIQYLKINISFNLIYFLSCILGIKDITLEQSDIITDEIINSTDDF